MARTQGHGNPNWTRDEVVLALDLYFDLKGQIPSGDDGRVQELSNLLRRLPYHAGASKRESFRNPTGVAFKLQNIRQMAIGAGLANVSKVDRQVWEDLGNNPQRAKHLATIVRAAIDSAANMPEIPETEFEFAEGRLITELHQRRERDPRIRKQLLKSRRKNGRLICDMCSVSPAPGIPDLEDAVYEAHHVVGMAHFGERITKLGEMALVCANCHRLIHRAISVEKRWLTIEEVRYISGVKRR